MEPNQKQLEIDLTQTAETVCDECQNNQFQQTFLMRRISALLSPYGEESYIPVAVFSCTKCNYIPKQFMPKQLQES